MPSPSTGASPGSRTPPGNGTVWTFRTVSTAAPNGRNLAAADIDKDSEIDLVYASLAGAGMEFVTWFENPGAGPAWTAHGLADSTPFSIASPADVDGDRDQDLFSLTNWHENLAGDGSSWATRFHPGIGLTNQPVDMDRDRGRRPSPGCARERPLARDTAGNGSGLGLPRGGRPAR